MRLIATLAAAATLLAGCSTIGEVNGIPVGPRAHLSTQNIPPFCQANPALCIVGGAVGVGVINYIVNQNGGGTCPTTSPCIPG